MNNLFGIVSITGPDAGTFLQGQLTQDLARLEDIPSLPAAWCSPKGRVITLFRMIRARDDSGEIALAMPAAMAAPVAQRLLTFRFRARVDIANGAEEWSAVALSRGEDLAALDALGLLPQGGPGSAARRGGIVAVDAGATPRCIEVYGRVSAVQQAGLSFARPLSNAEWQLALINAGIPVIGAEATEKYTPHMLNLDCLGAISFTKGCYTGQEVVARTQHLGKSNRRLAHFRTEEPFASAGDRLLHAERDAGEVLNALGEHFLAVVPLELHGQTLLLNGRPAAPVALPYALPGESLR